MGRDTFCILRGSATEQKPQSSPARLSWPFTFPCTVWSGARSPAGVGLGHVQTDNGGSPGTWENPVRSSANSRLEIPGYQLPALAAHSSAGERKQRVHPRYRQAKETKCGGMAAGRRSTFIVPTKPGNWSRRTRWREGKNRKGAPDVGTWAGNYVRGFVLGTTYHRHDPG